MVGCPLYYGTIMHIQEAPNGLSVVLHGNMTLEGRHGADVQGIWEYGIDGYFAACSVLSNFLL